jgi:SAM-dependent methyltransferase
MSSFDAKAATWDDDPTKAERARTVADLIGSVVPVPAGSRVLDVGAGTGLLSEHLPAHVGARTLLEPSAGMRAVIAQKVSAGRLPEGTQVWDLDLSVDPVPPDRFDLIASLMTLHHIADVPRALAACAELLDVGGHLALVDLVAEDGSFHGAGFDGHHGFDPHTLARQLTDLGLVEATVRDDVYGVKKGDRRYPLFLVTARKP